MSRRASGGHDSAPKRTRVLPPEGYKKGAVVRIKLHDFVTYSDVEVSPGPRLNVVVGPNGTGKSTLVSALALGLGGNPKHLGRSEDMESFIRHGCDEAVIEIELAGEPSNDPEEPQDNYIFKRVIAKNKRSKWYLNGKACSEQQVRQIIHQDLNVQVDNLCQFLPQDRVGNFTDMNPPMLLRETERALGGQQMVDDHDTLRVMGQEKTQAASQLNIKKTDLDQQVQLNERIRLDIQRMQERQELAKRVKFLDKKVKWLEFEQARLEGAALRKEHETLMKEVQRAEAALEPLKKRAEDAQKQVERFQTKIDNHQQVVRQLDNKRVARASALENSENKKSEIEAELRSIAARAASRHAKVENAQREVQEAEADLAAEMSQPDHTAEIEELQTKKTRYEKEVDNLVGELRQYKEQRNNKQDELNQLTQQIKGLDNARNQIMSRIRSQRPEVYKAWVWINENKAKFKQRVYGPLCAELDPNRSVDGAAMFLENLISKNNLLAFVVQNEEDQQVLQRELIGEQRLRITHILPNMKTPDQEPPFDKARLAKYGVTHWASEIFNAPPPVKKALMDNHGLFRIGIGSEVLNDKQAHALLDEVSEVTFVASPSRSYSKKFSRYDQTHDLVSVRQMRPASGLVGRQNQGELAEAKRKEAALRETLNALNRELEALERQKAEKAQMAKDIGQEISKLGGGKDRIEQLKRRLDFRKKALKNVEVEEDPAASEAKLRAELAQVAEKRISVFSDMAAALDQLVAAQLEMDELHLEKWVAVSEHLRLNAELADARTEFEEKKREGVASKHRLETAKEKVRQCLTAATGTTDRAERDRLIAQATEKYVDPEPRSLAAAQQLYQELKVRLDNTAQGNPHLIREYDERHARIEVLERDVAELSERTQRLTVELEKRETAWATKLRGWVAEISKYFSQYYYEIDCIGEVAVVPHEDYAQWGIEIRVQYRAGAPLQVLGTAVQSGGERSVATMLFLTSLQRLTQTPFRLVDEINQGMDKKFEYMIFTQISNVASLPNVPQYFLITPKLLPDLPYSDEVTVLCVFNGSYLGAGLDLNTVLRC